MKPNQIVFVLLVLLMGLLAGCVGLPAQDERFRLPIEEADIAQGEKSFVALQCNRCHTIRDYDIPAYEGSMPVTVELGGVMLIAKTHADLATSIVNPNYRLSQRYLKQFPKSERKNIMSSPMHGEIKDMKVSELVNLVAFLDSRYGSVPGYYRHYEW